MTMATVRDILSRKGTEVVSVPPTATVLEAARRMNERSIGGVAVLADGVLAGIFTERDVLRRVVVPGRPPGGTTVAEVMTTPVTTCTSNTRIEECAELMTSRRIRHLPVVDDGVVGGIVTIGDLLAFQVRDQQATIQYMNNLVYDVR
jgi:CBS domain-containing protein